MPNRTTQLVPEVTLLKSKPRVTAEESSVECLPEILPESWVTQRAFSLLTMDRLRTGTGLLAPTDRRRELSVELANAPGLSLSWKKGSLFTKTSG